MRIGWSARARWGLSKVPQQVTCPGFTAYPTHTSHLQTMAEVHGLRLSRSNLNGMDNMNRISRLSLAVGVALAVFAVNVLAADAGERKFIREGMTEAEVLIKIGKPDSQSEDTGGGSKVTVKRWIYMPAQGDARTMTTVVLKRGHVEEVTRQAAN